MQTYYDISSTAVIESQSSNNLLGTTRNDPRTILTNKQNWVDNEGTVYTLTGTNSEIVTPSGTYYNCIEITQETYLKEKVVGYWKAYYAPQIGLVQLQLKMPKMSNYFVYKELVQVQLIDNFDIASSTNQTELNQKLLDAASNADEEQVKELLNQGANPNASDTGGLTPLSVSYFSTDRNDYMFNNIVQLLIEAGADPNIPTNPQRDSALGNAIVRGNTDLVKVLLAAGADPSLEEDNGLTAMEMAQGFPEIQALLQPNYAP